MNELHAIFAYLADGRKVRIGKPSDWRTNIERWDRLDLARISRRIETGKAAPHIDGSAVRWYCVRSMDDPNWSDAAPFRLSDIRHPRPERTTTMSNTILGGAVRRPATGNHKSFAQARTVAKAANIVNGRGYRAVKAQDGTGAVIFRPAVASNRQRRVRAVKGL